ncbi:acyltransferase family protein [Actinomadura alba]|uniref:Acyltransferase family protein n=1 Tax=Actinomadura alba TaxID=406431 RepID=A0ABR7LIX3_9ACTN|nr:acyltransferase family protein [Actinomadura alba]MBC6464794.1 acyltransferase family protein [Actinomadura alba]
MTQTTVQPSSADPGSDPHGREPVGTQARPAPETAPRSRTRDPFFDNAKFLAILLVVSGHAIEGLYDVHLAHAAYLFIYMFHMPVFIVITGYFSRNFTFSGGKARKLITNLGVPYVVFEVAYSTYDWLVGQNRLQITLLDPYFLTWFLMALFMWRLSTPVWQQIRWPLGVAVAISLMSYMGPLSNQLDMHRVFGLVPFYVLGLLLRPEHFELLKRPAARVLGALVLAGGFAASFVVDRHMATEWVYWRSSHAKLNVDLVTGTLMRFTMLVVATVLVASFLAVVPRRRTWFTALGTTTLYAYLLHGFGTRLMKFASWYDLDWIHTVPGVIALAAGGAVVGTLLCTKPVVRVMQWALEPRMTWAFTPLRHPRAKR